MEKSLIIEDVWINQVSEEKEGNEVEK